VYYCPIASRNLYSVDAAVLTDFTQSDAAVAATVKNLGDKGEVGGLEADAQGRVYLTNGSSTPSCGSIRRRERRTLSTRRLRRWFTTGIWSGGFAGVGEGRGRSTLPRRRVNPFASFQRGAGSAAAAVLSVQGTDGRDAGDAVRAKA